MEFVALVERDDLLPFAPGSAEADPGCCGVNPEDLRVIRPFRIVFAGDVNRLFEPSERSRPTQARHLDRMGTENEVVGV